MIALQCGHSIESWVFLKNQSFFGRSLKQLGQSIRLINRPEIMGQYFRFALSCAERFMAFKSSFVIS